MNLTDGNTLYNSWRQVNLHLASIVFGLALAAVAVLVQTGVIQRGSGDGSATVAKSGREGVAASLPSMADAEFSTHTLNWGSVATDPGEGLEGARTIYYIVDSEAGWEFVYQMQQLAALETFQGEVTFQAGVLRELTSIVPVLIESPEQEAQFQETLSDLQAKGTASYQVKDLRVR
jgi:hypothetical protein